ncbi:MAG: F0F1 ATP synthase subunit epsilon [Crocinitomicaceae bacterium]|nr:F0F1 ATP synthase subunit epsilon [Crocinitomicaceae bacterium]
MRLEIITPDKKLFEGEVDAVSFPGIDGSFQVLKGHAPIISTLKEGRIKVSLSNDEKEIDMLSGEIENDPSNDRIIRLSIKGGVVEMQNDKIIVLAD